MNENLIKWIKDNGGYIHPQLYIVTNKINNTFCNSIYFKNTQPIEKNTQLVKLPHKLIISIDTFNNIPNIKNFSKLINRNSIKLKLVVALLHERFKKESSFYYPYINVLPNFNTFIHHPIYLCYLNSSAFEVLDDLNVEFSQIVSSKSQELREFIDILLTIREEIDICADYTSNDELKQMIIWSFFILTTRSWGDKIIPFSDNFNHSNSSNIFLEYGDLRDKSYSFYADGQFKQDEGKPFEVFISYGHYALMSLESYYDFLPDDKVSFLRVTITLSSDDKFKELKIKEIKKCKFHAKRFLLSNEGSSKDLFRIMRIISLDETEYKLFSKDSDTHKYKEALTPKNELKSIRLLMKIILDLKESKYSLDIMNKTYILIKSMNEKELLSNEDKVVKNICDIKVKEYQIIQDSLIWANNRMLKVIKQL